MIHISTVRPQEYDLTIYSRGNSKKQNRKKLSISIMGSFKRNAYILMAISGLAIFAPDLGSLTPRTLLASTEEENKVEDEEKAGKGDDPTSSGMAATLPVAFSLSVHCT
jgi:hypothetical protein